MPVASAPSTSKRLLALLSLLQSRRDWPAHALAARLGVSERTVRRDVDRLRELEYAIDATRGPDGGYRLGAGATLPPLMLDDEQAVAVAIALRGAEASAAGIGDAAERALQTLGRTMPARLARRIETVALTTTAVPDTRSAEVDPAVLLRIGEAIRSTEELRFDYASPGRDAAEAPQPLRRAEPHHLLLHGGRWYLIGWSPDRGDWRTWRVDRMTPSGHTGRRFTPRPLPGGDPVRYLSAHFKGSTGEDVWPCRGEVLLHAPVGAVAPYLGDGAAEPVGPDHCRVRLGAWSWAGLAASFARLDADVSEAAPAELRRAFADLGRRAALAAG